MTEKLYYESSHRKDFEAPVISYAPEGDFSRKAADSMQIPESWEEFMCWTHRRRTELFIIIQTEH